MLNGIDKPADAPFLVPFGKLQFMPAVVQFHHRNGSTNRVCPEED